MYHKCDSSFPFGGILNIFLVATGLPLCVTVATQESGCRGSSLALKGSRSRSSATYFLRGQIIISQTIVSKGSQTCITYSLHYTVGVAGCPICLPQFEAECKQAPFRGIESSGIRVVDLFTHRLPSIPCPGLPQDFLKALQLE